MYRAWLEIDLGAITHNFHEVRRSVGTDVEICAIVKADAYGHGSVECSKVLIKTGVNSLGVATCDEAFELRNNDINCDIAVLAHSPDERFMEIITASLTQTISSLDTAKKLSKVASELNKTARVHVKIDTGMGRIGFSPMEQSIDTIMEISRLPFILIDGISSHFAMSECMDKSYTYKQYERYMFVANALRKRGLPFRAHICNSGGIINHPQMHMDIVRPGALLYGLNPLEWDCGLDLRHAMTLKARICHISRIKAGESVGYDRIFVAERETLVGTIVIGYADGFVSSLSGNSRVIAGNGYAPVIGRVCMDQMMVDLTDIYGVNVGDEVILLGEKGVLKITPNDLAHQGNIRTREVLCALGNAKRIPRLYKCKGD